MEIINFSFIFRIELNRQFIQHSSFQIFLALHEWKCQFIIRSLPFSWTISFCREIYGLSSLANYYMSRPKNESGECFSCQHGRHQAQSAWAPPGSVSVGAIRLSQSAWAPPGSVSVGATKLSQSGCHHAQSEWATPGSVSEDAIRLSQQGFRQAQSSHRTRSSVSRTLDKGTPYRKQQNRLLEWRMLL